MTGSSATSCMRGPGCRNPHLRAGLAGKHLPQPNLNAQPRNSHTSLVRAAVDEAASMGVPRMAATLVATSGEGSEDKLDDGGRLAFRLNHLLPPKIKIFSKHSFRSVARWFIAENRKLLGSL